MWSVDLWVQSWDEAEGLVREEVSLLNKCINQAVTLKLRNNYKETGPSMFFSDTIFLEFSLRVVCVRGILPRLKDLAESQF